MKHLVADLKVIMKSQECSLQVKSLKKIKNKHRNKKLKKDKNIVLEL